MCVCCVYYTYVCKNLPTYIVRRLRRRAWGLLLTLVTQWRRSVGHVPGISSSSGFTQGQKPNRRTTTIATLAPKKILNSPTPKKIHFFPSWLDDVIIWWSVQRLKESSRIFGTILNRFFHRKITFCVHHTLVVLNNN